MEHWLGLSSSSSAHFPPHTIVQIYAVTADINRPHSPNPARSHMLLQEAEFLYRCIFYVQNSTKLLLAIQTKPVLNLFFLLGDCISTACLKLKPKGGTIRGLIYY